MGVIGRGFHANLPAPGKGQGSHTASVCILCWSVLLIQSNAADSTSTAFGNDGNGDDAYNDNEEEEEGEEEENE